MHISLWFHKVQFLDDIRACWRWLGLLAFGSATALAVAEFSSVRSISSLSYYIIGVTVAD